jgi:hypothetical protein
LVGASELLGVSERWGASEQVLSGLGASEQLQPSNVDRGEVAPTGSVERIATDQSFRPDISSEAFAPGASEQVVAARYPDSLDDDPFDKGGA